MITVVHQNILFQTTAATSILKASDKSTCRVDLSGLFHRRVAAAQVVVVVAVAVAVVVVVVVAVVVVVVAVVVVVVVVVVAVVVVVVVVPTVEVASKLH